MRKLVGGKAVGILRREQPDQPRPPRRKGPLAARIGAWAYA